MQCDVKNSLIFTLQRGKLNSEKSRKVYAIMSEAFHIISDGSCDLPLELTKEKNITVVPFYVSLKRENIKKKW